MMFLSKVATACAVVSSVVRAQVNPVQPFGVTGFLDSLSLDCLEYNCGGHISVNGFDIVVPKNLLWEFPAAFIAHRKLFDGNKQPLAFFGESRYEISVTGNTVNGEVRAALIKFAQLDLQASVGYIEKVNYGSTNPSIKIKNGPTIRINDPNGVYTSGSSDYKFFTSDDENPSIIASTGYPMCIPRTADGKGDNLCPDTNRPNGGADRNFISPDAMKMAPFSVGDFLDYSGVKLPNGDILCYGITANVGIFTNPGTQPAYIRVEDAIIGIIDPSAGVEFARSRWVGMTSDASANVDIFAIDVDPCTGVETDRLLGSATPRPLAADGRAKWEFRTDRGSVGKYTREVRLKLSTGVKETDNKIQAGQYVQPITEFIFPEVTTPGQEWPTNDFDDFYFLAQGFGPDEDGNVFGQLDPWPGLNKPTLDHPPCQNPVPPTTPPTGTGGTPAADAGTDIVARTGVLIKLAGANTNAALPDSQLTFAWTQFSGPTVTLTDANTKTPSFVAPAGASVREFDVTVKDTVSGQTSKDRVKVTINTTDKDVVTIDTYTWVSRQSGTADVTAHSNVVDGTAKLRIKFGNGNTNDMVSVGGGKFTFSRNKTPQNQVILVTSNLGGSATKNQNTLKKRIFKA